MPRPRKSTALLCLEALESRDLLSVSSLWFSGSTLVVKTDNVGTSVNVQPSGSNVVVSEGGTTRSWQYAAASVAQVEFQGGAGSDRFVNDVPSLPSRAFGFGGNDYLEGYNGADVFVGGDGNDKLLGYGGNDTLYGGNGNDVLLGMAGDDQLVGDAGDDRLNGREGNDKLWAGAGADVLIAVDNATGDYLQGDADRDTVWLDRTGTANDWVYGTEAGDKVQYVTGFTNGADRTLDGDRIADPLAKAGHGYRTFANNPLFPSTGPAADDVRQGQLGDCWLLAGLAAIAEDTPLALRQNVVDFDDGTYGVRLGNSFYRVDNDLAVNGTTGTTPVYAALGRENSMWAAVVEKAYAHYRYGTNSFASIEGGWSVDVNRAFGATATGDRAFSSYSSATALANDIYAHWNNYESVTIGFLSARTSDANAPLVMSHMYTVMSVTRNAAGQVTAIVLRNPWGVDGAGNDGNTGDGLVTVTPFQLFQYNARVNWGHV